MTIFKFQGTVHREGGPMQYGEISISGGIQIMNNRSGMSAGTIYFQNHEETKIFLDQALKAWRESIQKNEPYLKTIIEPEQGTPVYDNVGEELTHAVESELLYKAYDAIGSFPILPPYAKK